MNQKFFALAMGASVMVANLGYFTASQAPAFPALSIAQMTDTPITQPLSDRLVNTEWLLEDLAGAGVIDNLQTTLRFDETHRISGYGGCNRYRATAQLTAQAEQEIEMGFTVDAVASTRMLCTPAAMNQEARYFQALEKAERIRLEGSFLLVYSEGSEAPLRFTQLTTAVESP
ncbi:MAG: META domain-containing protein [Oscillatoriophycideae cyanobacterium NC_groundwater_1537_Pr4_S-0.65um_50_18]|nr:META domain-containing protein [Oscillatoriophycideae cyanobacterium NC_groundwater_1537_Pr4_S-0.65um_50_18]